MKPNHSKYFLPKKGAISFIFSKLAFLIFAIAITMVFFYVANTERSIQNVDKLAKTSDSIGSVIDTMASSRHAAWIVYRSNENALINFQNQSFTLEKNGKKIKHGLIFQINASLSDKNIEISCLNITNLNGVAIKKCL